MRELAEPSWAADGIFDDRVNTDIADPIPFRVAEQSEDEAAFGAHVEMGQSRPETERRLYKPYPAFYSVRLDHNFPSW